MSGDMLSRRHRVFNAPYYGGMEFGGVLVHQKRGHVAHCIVSLIEIALSANGYNISSNIHHGPSRHG
jgi:hypothetical protein